MFCPIQGDDDDDDNDEIADFSEGECCHGFLCFVLERKLKV